MNSESEIKTKTDIISKKGEENEQKFGQYNNYSNKVQRYFQKINYQYQTQIQFHEVRCYICNEFGHISKDCEKRNVLCFRCLGNHKEENCPLRRCKQCHLTGHSLEECPLNYDGSYPKDVPYCTKCNNYSHFKEDCLLCPKEIIISEKSKFALCNFCGSHCHYLCPHDEDISVLSPYESDNILIESDGDNDNGTVKIRKIKNIKKNEKTNIIPSPVKNYRVNKNKFESIFNYFMNEIQKNKKMNKNLFSEIDNDEIKDTIFCCKCGNMHNSRDCRVKVNKKKEKNKDYELSDDCYAKVRKVRISTKNPLKYGPVFKKEYRINHHNIKNNYYDKSDSSGEPFEKLYEKK